MDKMADMQQESKDLQVHVRSLQEKMEVINQVWKCWTISRAIPYESAMSC